MSRDEHGYPVRNTSGEVIPARALMRVADQDSYANNGYFTVAKPNTDSQINILINCTGPSGGSPIPVGGYGRGHCESLACALFDTGDGTPAAGEHWGAEASSWKLNKLKTGAVVVSAGDASAGFVNIRHNFHTAAGITVQDDDANPSYSGIHTIQFDQDDGFAITNPSTGVVKIDFSSAGSTDIKAKVSSADTTTDYLATKIVSADSTVELAITSPAGDERLDLSIDGVTVPAMTVTTLTSTTTNVTNLVSNSVTWLSVINLSSSQNNYSVGIGVYVLILNVTANISITGITINGSAPIAGRTLFICNVGTHTLTLPHASGSSTAAYRFALPGGSDVVIPAGGGQFSISYGTDGGSTQRWTATAPMAYPNLYQLGTLSSIANLNTLAGLSALSANVQSILQGADYSAIRTLLSLVIGTNVQAYDATLTALAGLTIAANSLTIGTGADAFSQTTFAANTLPARASTGDLVAKTVTDFMLTVFDDSDAATARATLGAGDVSSVVEAPAAAGSTQGDATALSAYNIVHAAVSGADGTKGVRLSATNRIVILRNTGSFSLKVYPESGAAISSNGTNNADSVLTGSNLVYYRMTSTQWYKGTIS